MVSVYLVFGEIPKISANIWQVICKSVEPLDIVVECGTFHALGISSTYIDLLFFIHFLSETNLIDLVWRSL